MSSSSSSPASGSTWFIHLRRFCTRDLARVLRSSSSALAWMRAASFSASAFCSSISFSSFCLSMNRSCSSRFPWRVFSSFLCVFSSAVFSRLT